jgi:hypothetical protein
MKYTGDDPIQLWNEIQHEQQVLDKQRARLAEIRARCQHAWTEPRYDPIVTPGFEAGDEPGTMGSDYMPKTWIPPQETPLWRRTCKKCGLEQQTERTRDDIRKVPVF